MPQGRTCPRGFREGPEDPVHSYKVMGFLAFVPSSQRCIRSQMGVRAGQADSLLGLHANAHTYDQRHCGFICFIKEFVV